MALVILATTVLRNQPLENQMYQTLEVLAHPATSVQVVLNIQLPAKVASTILGGHKVNALFVLLVISVRMLRQMLLTAPKDSTAPTAQRQLFHVQKGLTRMSPWVIMSSTAQSVLLENIVSLAACLSHQVCVLVVGSVLVGHGRRGL